MRRTIVRVAPLLWLAGCMVGPDYERPKLDVPAAWRSSEKAAKAIGNPFWWEQYGDRVLNDLVKESLEGNKDLKIATARIDQYMGMYGISKSALYPQVGVGAFAGRQRVSETFGGSTLNTGAVRSPEFNHFELTLNASWELDLWGKLRRATEAAKASLLASEESRKSVQLTLVAAVTNSYIALRNLDRQLELTKATAKSYESIYTILDTRYKFGWVSAMERNQAKEQYEHASANVPFFEKSVAFEENRLSILLGRNPGPIARGKKAEEFVLPAVPSNLPSEVLENRPDVREAEQNLVAANANIGVAKSLYYPSISLTGFFGTASSSLSDLFKSSSRIWGLGAPVSMPLFTGGALSSGVEVAEAVQQQTLFRYQQVIQNAFREVNDALIDQDRTKQQLAALDRQIESLREYVRLAWVRFNEGESGYLEVSYSQNLLYAAELERADVQRILFQAYSNLYKAMGIGT